MEQILMDKDFNNDLRAFIFTKAYFDINLAGNEISTGFLDNIYSGENLLKLENIYLNYLNVTDKDAFDALKKEDGFDGQEVIKSFSENLYENHQKYAVVFKLLRHFYESEKFKEETPLMKLARSSSFERLFSGLELTSSERNFFILCLLNHRWGWLFPENKDRSYKAKVAANFFVRDVSSVEEYVQSMNVKFLKLGLFSDYFEPAPYVLAALNNDPLPVEVKKIHPVPFRDSYDPEVLCNENCGNLQIMNKFITGSFSEQSDKGGYYAVYGSDFFRIRELLSYTAEKNYYSVYELIADYIPKNKNEIDFFIYYAAQKLKGKRAVLFLDERITTVFCDDTSPMDTSILRNVQVPVLLACKELSKEQKTLLSFNGIDLLYSWELKLPREENYKERIIHFYVGNGVPENLIKPAVDECIELDVNSVKWPEIAKVLKMGFRLTPEETKLVIQNMYSSGKKNSSLRKNSHYSFEAINSDFPVNELIDALKNADDFQKGQYDSDSGIRIKIYGPSGTGKSAFTEQVAKELNKNLTIVRSSDVLGSYVGETERNIKMIFEKAAEEHSILLIDEADSFLHARGDTVNRHNDLKVNEFLVQMERFPGILFCSTNFPESLDKATDRRFHFNIGFNPLTEEGIEKLCKSYFSDYSLSESQIKEIKNSGDVTPGDFGALFNRMRFLSKDKFSSEYICNELCKIVRDKCRSNENRKIGFAA